jgi:hypothetical protein
MRCLTMVAQLQARALSMTRTKQQRVKDLISELEVVEFENAKMLDDDSIRFLAEVRDRQLITDDEWARLKVFLKEALVFLSRPPTTVTRNPDGTTIIDPDADPRNADWLRIHAACNLAHRDLPMWAALWLWRLRTDKSRIFWRKIGKLAEELGFPVFPK